AAYDLVLTDLALGSGPSGMDVLGKVKALRPESAVVMITAHGSEKIAVEAMKAGAEDYVPKPFDNDQIRLVVARALERTRPGHEKGAFTGADARRSGRFEAAHGGTIFLDEIGDMAPDTQAKVLRVLQERSFERVGGSAPIEVDVRVVAATHRNLEHEVARGSFR